jgi:two-component system NtrC family sensor kinase
MTSSSISAKTDAVYDTLQRRMIFITLLVSVLPLLVLLTAMYYHFTRVYQDKIEEQMAYRANTHAEAMEQFLKERSLVLGAMADIYSLQEMTNEDTLAKIFDIINRRGGGFADIGVVDESGQILAYIGNYELKGLNLIKQSWFAKALRHGEHVSDVFMGYRQMPHFIVAIRRHENGKSRILMATVDPDLFGRFVRSAQVGKTGDAYLINSENIFQTRPRFDGEILSESDLDPNLFGGRTTVIERKNRHGNTLLYAGTRLKDHGWILVVSQNPAEEMGNAVGIRNLWLGIGIAVSIGIILITVFAVRLSVRRLKAGDAKMSELNARLVQADKLGALGKMAAGVAHEINNPLAVILQMTGWMRDLLEEEEFKGSANFEEYRSSLRKIERHVERSRKIVHDLLGYTRRMEPRAEDVDVSKTLNQTISLLKNYALSNNIEIQTEISPDLPIISSDSAQLQQIFLNLISNAIDAVGKNGMVQVSASCSSDYIHIQVKDNGPYIPEDQQGSVFDPFFTVKESGRGSGLGLWVIYDTVRKIGGSVNVESYVGQHTVFTVNIPIIIPEKK